MALHTMTAVEDRVAAVLQDASASPEMARSTARALVAAEALGMGSHGLSRVAQYAAHLRNGRADGQARPLVSRAQGAGVLVDAGHGLAFPACELAVAQAVERARACGIGFAGVVRSHHFGMAGIHLDAVAAQGLVGLAFTNSPAAMPAWGGSRPLFGTNPVAAIFPRRNAEPLCIDLSLSEVARGKLMVAAREGRAIPEGWALDRDGRPTTDPQVGLDGMMCPAGGVKGAMLALVVELLCVALTGASFGYEADSFFSEAGNRPNIGHVFLVIDPGALAGQPVYEARVEALVAAMLQDEAVRLPGGLRGERLRRGQAEGIEVPDALWASWAA